jgi:hypothetical protein
MLSGSIALSSLITALNYGSPVMRFCYSIGNSLYIPLTTKCNSLSLPETRGPRFLLSSQTVAALCRFRDAVSSVEDASYKPKWQQWCEWLDMQDERSVHKLPELVRPKRDIWSNSKTLLHRRLISELVSEACSSDLSRWSAIVIGGEGEPTLQHGALIQVVEGLHQQKDIDAGRYMKQAFPPIRITTNGLVDTERTNLLLRSLVQRDGLRFVDSFSVALMTHTNEQYMTLMQPAHDQLSLGNDKPYQVVCNFIRSVIDSGIEVEVTAIDRIDVDKDATEAAAMALGVTAPVRWRSYFP